MDPYFLHRQDEVNTPVVSAENYSTGQQVGENYSAYLCLIFQVVATTSGFRAELVTHFTFLPCVLHIPSISFALI
jgi:hypothetical protein